MGPVDGGPVDAGPPDSGPVDSGLADAGPDAGTVDAGPEDAGPEDAGLGDAGPEDAGLGDAGPEDAGLGDAGPEDAGSGDAGVADAGMGSVDAGTVASATDLLNQIANAFIAFHDAELRWPLADGTWDPRLDSPEAPVAFGTIDTALFSPTTDLQACSDTTRGPCWQGPFLSPGTSLGADPWLDPWGKPFMVALIPPFATGGGVSSAPEGAVVLWSTGPDRIDQTGCSTGACALDERQLAAGEPSVAGSDDIVVLVAPAVDPASYTTTLLSMVTTYYLQFHADADNPALPSGYTYGFWPFGNSYWSADPNFEGDQVDPLQYFTGDTALASQPTSPTTWGGPGTGVWQGPYLWPDVASMADPPMQDGWGNTLYFAYIRPRDGNGGGTATVPGGAIVLWSAGPNGIDETGCTTGACAVQIDQLAQGQPSVSGADDVIVVVSAP